MESLAVKTTGDVAWPLAQRAERAGTTVQVRDVEIGGREFIVIAGPCSVETREQMAKSPAASDARAPRCFARVRSTTHVGYASQGLGAEGRRCSPRR